MLADELGLEPGSELREVQAAVLRQDPVLDWHPPTSAGAAAPAATTPTEPAAGAFAEAPQVPSPAAPHTQASWPLAGRAGELAALDGALRDALAGRAGFVSLVGEPGIGKSRLAGELAAIASRQGVRVVEGRCSQDEGAPPLWPWQQVLRALRIDLEVTDARDEGAAFRTWEAVVGAVLGAAEGRRSSRRAGRPALGRRVDVAGPAPARRGRQRRTAARGHDVAGVPAAGRRPRRPRRDAGPPPCDPPGVERGRRLRRRRDRRCGHRSRPDRPAGTGPRRADRRQPVLPRRIRPPGPRAWSLERPSGRTESTVRSAGCPDPPAGPAAVRHARSWSEWPLSAVGSSTWRP